MNSDWMMLSIRTNWKTNKSLINLILILILVAIWLIILFWLILNEHLLIRNEQICLFDWNMKVRLRWSKTGFESGPLILVVWVYL